MDYLAISRDAPPELPVPPIHLRERDDILDKIAELAVTRGRFASSDVLVIQGQTGIGKTRLAIEYAYRYESEYVLLDWGASPISGIAHGRLLAEAATPMPARPWRELQKTTLRPPWAGASPAQPADSSYQWLRFEALRPPHESAVPEWAALRSLPGADASSGGDDQLVAGFTRQPLDPVVLFVRLSRDGWLRAGMLQLIDGILAALCLALVLAFALYARRFQGRSFVLILIAISRHYGHRSEPDDHALPVHRWMSVIGGEPVVVH